MKALRFTVDIHAGKDKIWEVLWNPGTYEQWTAAFCAGARVVTHWKEGDDIEFLDGSGRGMFGTIEKNALRESMIFRHLGEVKDGKREPRDWGGALEQYHLITKDEVTQLDVSLDLDEKYESYFNDTFPKALAKIKELAESTAR